MGFDLSAFVRSQIKKVAIDDGSGNAVLCYTDGSKTIEGIRRSIIQVGKESYGGNGTSPNSWQLPDGSVFTVSLKSQGRQSTASKKWQFCPENLVLNIDTLAGIEDLTGMPIILGSTLPTEMYYNGDKVNTDNIANKTKNLMRQIENLSGERAMPNIIGIQIFPEAIPAYYSVAFDENGYREGFTPKANSSEVIVADIGRFTIDVARLTVSTESITTGDSDLLTVEGVAVENTVTHFRHLLTENADKIGISDASAFSDDQLDEAISTGLLNDDFDVREEAAAARAHLATNTITAIHRLANTGLDGISHLVVVGGGANWIGDHARGEVEGGRAWVSMKRLHIPEQPEYAIARGINRLMDYQEDDLLEKFAPDVLKREAQAVAPEAEAQD
ncbi:plasmid segregation protein ParM domain-containing protein [Thaumasiovibrio sp. DFM-14]|uniref:plasmid segregation protein ParM domain-containing protein n=1 Tax=Thaumasiovibrio sp. DFM-14 TaxID=3384792 RepID=UPI0039A3B84E